MLAFGMKLRVGTHLLVRAGRGGVMPLVGLGVGLCTARRRLVPHALRASPPSPLVQLCWRQAEPCSPRPPPHLCLSRCCPAGQCIPLCRLGGGQRPGLRRRLPIHARCGQGLTGWPLAWPPALRLLRCAAAWPAGLGCCLGRGLPMAAASPAALPLHSPAALPCLTLPGNPAKSRRRMLGAHACLAGAGLLRAALRAGVRQ